MFQNLLLHGCSINWLPWFCLGTVAQYFWSSFWAQSLTWFRIVPFGIPTAGYRSVNTVSDTLVASSSIFPSAKPSYNKYSSLKIYATVFILKSVWKKSRREAIRLGWTSKNQAAIKALECYRKYFSIYFERKQIQQGIQ